MIVKMKFLSITGPKADIDRVVNTYLSKYEIHLENALTLGTSTSSSDDQQSDSQQNAGSSRSAEGGNTLTSAKSSCSKQKNLFIF